MHLKVAVVDGGTVMTGSFNWNGTAALANDENMIVLRDPEVVDHYRRQVLEVRGDEPHVIEGGPMTDDMALHFSPEERLDDVLVSHIGQADSSVDVAMFTFTSAPVIDALVAAVDRGVQVRAVLEHKQTGFTSADEQLEQAGALELDRPDPTGDPEAWLAEAHEVDRASWKAERGTNLLRHPSLRGFLRDVVPAMAARGWIDLHVMRLDGRAVAHELCFDFGGRVFWHANGQLLGTFQI